jgi:excisionase family DNA binding protein
VKRPALLTIPEAAPFLRISSRRAYQLAEAGKLPGLRRLGDRRYLVSKAEIEAFIGVSVDEEAA